MRMIYIVVNFGFLFSDFSFSHTILEEYNCQQDDVQYGVTLKGGTMAGVFKDHGRVKNIQECAHLCCTAKKCDVAMMYGRKCLGVQCFNETSCETIPSDDPQLDLQIVHVSSKGTGNLGMYLTELLLISIHCHLQGASSHNYFDLLT